MGKGPMSAPEQFGPDEVRLLIKLERIGGCISLVAVMLVFIVYAFFPKVRNVQNTFIVFASVSNAGASVATIIAFDGLRKGTGSTLCKAQSFLFEMFMQSDPWWSLAMAVNVLLVFYFRATPDSFARWWWVYCLVCYGGPFVIALTLLLTKNAAKGPIYGEATIWCWVDRQWDDIRIYTYYMLIWICIAGSLLCYALVGYHVFRSRDRLRSLTASSRDPAVEMPRNDENTGSYATVVTEVQVTSTAGEPRSCPTSLPRPKPAEINTQIPVQSVFEHSPTEAPSGLVQYFSSVESPSRRPREPRPPLMQRVKSSMASAARRFTVADPVKRAYLRTSFLFAISVLVTWIPSSMNRIHGWIDGQSPYEFHVATAAVLPLQGLWNCIIFFVTSWNVLQRHRRNTAASAAATEAIDRFHQDSAQRTTARASYGHGDPRRYDSHSETDLGDGDSRTISSDIELQRRSKSQGTSTPPVA
ncbi:cAMP receptor-like protein, putative [Cordyceps militaris CM01]|uniref:cAMP receptor-like protein, putative n=1 Tax=Cordyceps militaris (strain CM01) TaxID=983644 RepID=G3J6U6_CORMM|nr:cAMP receptor-like protein, putative [Cordyceps militaris CM01]EGX96223.1 cAMP receptor-like protein, putative [Cordyceps militaris CM01]